MSFFGKEYVVDRSENFEAFLNSLGPAVDEELKQKIINAKMTVKLLKDGDEYTMISSVGPGHVTETKFKSGVEFDEKVRNNNAKSKITVDGNTVTHVQKFPEATLTFTRVFSDDGVVVTISSSKWDGKCTRYFKAV